MTGFRIDGIGPVRYSPLGRPIAEPASAPRFQETLAKALSEVNELQMDAGRQTTRLVAGEEVDLHDVMMSSEEAGLAFELMLEIRNKLLEAYQEMQRMQI